MINSITPKLFTVLSTHSRSQFFKDILAGILVGIIAIPLSIALAISSGVRPEAGLYTAIVAGFMISFLGGSRVQIGGPTAAFVSIVYGIVQQHGMDGLAIATLMGGIFMVLMGLCKFGRLIKFIPYTVITGFTAGIAIAILVKQFKDFLGLQMTETPGEFIPLIKQYASHINSLHVPTLVLGLFSLAIIVFWSKLKWSLTKFIPGSLIAIIASCLAVKFGHIEGIATIGSNFTDLRAGFPPLTIPANVNLEMIEQLLGPALIIAVLASVESLLSAVVSDGMIGGHHRSNAELVGQGAANIASAVLGGIPATGAIARTVANIRAGGRTPIAGIVHALSVLVITLVLMPQAKIIPMTTLAAILIIVAYNMGDWGVFRAVLKAPVSDRVVFLATFALTVVFDLVIAIEVGMVLAAFLFMKRMAELTRVEMLDEEHLTDILDDQIFRSDLFLSYGEKALLYEISGPFFFGAAHKLMDVVNKVGMTTELIIIKMQNVSSIDTTGLHHLRTLLKTCRKHNVSLYLCDLQPELKKTLIKTDFVSEIGQHALCSDIKSALKDYQQTHTIN